MYIENLKNQSVQWLISLGISEYWSIMIQSLIVLLIISLISWQSKRFLTYILSHYIPIWVKNTKTKWDDFLLKHNFFKVFSYYFLGFFFFYLDIFIASDSIRLFSESLMFTYFTIVTAFVINSFLNALYDVYRYKRPKDTGVLNVYVQTLKVLTFSFAIIIIISIYANKNLLDILKGLGAMATILLIVYKDTILGLVAGVNLAANKMLEVGDWICLPQYHADGTVIEIGLNTIKVQNWDMTITTIPPYKLISESFINWKGMENSGGRRIKRSINIDIDSIRFLSKEDIERFSKFRLLKDYIEYKKTQIPNLDSNDVEVYNSRRLTNIGTFKKYVENYLRDKQIANEDMTFLVRQLQSNERGLPLEIYFFSKEKAWAKYEDIQADIFDHLFAILKEFDLRVFQNISAASTRNLIK